MRPALAAAVTCLTLTLAPRVEALDDALGSTATTEQRILELEHRQRVLESIVERAPRSAKPWSRTGFWLMSPDDTFRLRLGGVVQVDERAFVSQAPPGADQFLVRRARIYIEGVVQDHIEYRVLPDFAAGQPLIQEAWIDFNYWPEFRIQAGKMKEPLSLERLQADVETLFIERALTADVAPNRDEGVAAHGALFSRRIDYTVALVNGAADGASIDNDSDNNKDVVARLFATPFAGSDSDIWEGLGFGVGGSLGRQRDGGAAGIPTYASEAQQAFFSYSTGVTATGPRRRLTPQAYWRLYNFGVMAEYIESSQALTKGATSEQLTTRAYQVAGSWMLTGEKRSFDGVKPKVLFDPHSDHWGALELAARYSALWVDRDAFPVFAAATQSARRADAESLGLNWYLNGNVRVSVDYLRTLYAGGPSSLEQAVFTRLQMSF